MTITAKFASICPCCNVRIVPGSAVEWSKGSSARHVACASSSPTPPRKAIATRTSGAYYGHGRRPCKTDGNCSSFGSGRSCGGYDCDGM